MKLITPIGVVLTIHSFVALGQETPCIQTFNDNSKYIKFSWANDALKLRGITDRYLCDLPYSETINESKRSSVCIQKILPP